MIEGNLKDVSLPGLLKFLASELNKSYRIKIASGGNSGELFVSKGQVVAASYGLLEGEDALCEFLAWHEGIFWVELLSTQFEVRKNLVKTVKPTADFVDQCAFLIDRNVGLNTLISASRQFGGPEWQETVKISPLDREDFVVIGWLGEGRSMRQTLREFDFDIVQSTGILTRLMKSGSVEVIRPLAQESEEGLPVKEPNPSEPSTGFEPAAVEADKEKSEAKLQRFVPTGGQEAAAASVAQEAARSYAQEAAAAVAQEAFISTSYRSTSHPPVPEGNNPPDKPQKAVDLAQVRASMEARLRARAVRDSRSMPAMPPLPPLPDSPLPSYKKPPPPASSTLPAESKETAAPVASHRDTRSDSPEPLSTVPPASDPTGQPQRLSLGDLIAGAKAGEPQNPPKAVTQDQVQPASSSKPGKVIPPVEPEAIITQSARTGDAGSMEADGAHKPRHRTGTMPMVSIDIDRLLEATFNPTQFGRSALNNPNLDALRRQTLLDVESGKSLENVISEGIRPAAAVLSSYRYCLDRGYIETVDPVIPITADLLLGRMEIDQYLLQRRRITGDELRDLVTIARKEAAKLPELLVRSGYLTAASVKK